LQFNSIQFKKLSQGSNESLHVSENDDLIPLRFNSIQFKKLSQGSNESMHVSENDDLIPLRFLPDYESDMEEFLRIILLEYEFRNATTADNVSRHHEICQDY
jgi:hypothetical protein